MRSPSSTRRLVALLLYLLLAAGAATACSPTCSADSDCTAIGICSAGCCTACSALIPHCEKCSAAGSVVCTACQAGWHGANCNLSTVVKRLFNGGFEDGLIGWTTTGDTDYTDAGLVRGDAEAARTGTGSLRTGPVAVGFLSQTCDTTAGRPHQLSFWLRGGYDGNEYQFAVKLDPAPLALQEGVLGPNGTVLNISGVDEFGWTRHAVTFVPSSAQLGLLLPRRRLANLGGLPCHPVGRGWLGCSHHNLFLEHPPARRCLLCESVYRRCRHAARRRGASGLCHRRCRHRPRPFAFTWSYTAAGTPPTQRWFVVEADADGEGPGQRAASSVFGPVLLGVPPAPQLSNLRGSAGTEASLDVTAVEGATTYSIQARRYGTNTWMEVLTAAGTGTNTMSMLSTGAWRFRARAGNAGNWGEWSTTDYVAVGLPAAPEGFSATSPSPGRLRVAFNVTPEHLELGTRFYVRGLRSTPWEVYPREAGPFNASNLVAGGNYSVRVTAENDNSGPDGEPPSTSVVAIKVAVDVPTIQAARSSTTSATLFVALANPHPLARYYIKAFKTGDTTQPDGDKKQVYAKRFPGIDSGTAAAPFVFRWRYSAPGAPPAQRWFVVEVVVPGTSTPAVSKIAGPVLLGTTAPRCDAWAFKRSISSIVCAACQDGWQGNDCERSSGAERLVNGDFLAGETGWNKTGDTSITRAAPSMLPAGAVRTAATGGLQAGTAWGVTLVSQRVSTAAGRPHRLSFSLRAGQREAGYYFGVIIDPAPAPTPQVLEPQGDEAAPRLSDTELDFTATQEFGWTQYFVAFVPTLAETTIQFAFRHSSDYIFMKDVSLTTEDYPVVQASSSKNAASFKVALDYPKPGAAYYLRVYKDAARTQPDGGEQRISFTSGAGTAAAPFTFTWSYKAAGTPATQRWFVVEVDADGEGPGKRVASSMVGPVLLGLPAVPQLSSLRGSNATSASLSITAVAGATKYTIEAQRNGTATWRVVNATAAAGVNTVNLLSMGRWRFRARAGNTNGWGSWSNATSDVIVGLPSAPTGFAVSSPAAGLLRVAFTVTSGHLELGTRFYVRGAGSTRRQVSPRVAGAFAANITVAPGKYSVYIDAENNNLLVGRKPASVGPLVVTVAKLLSPSIVSVTGSGSRGPTLRFLRPANAGSATLAWNFMLLSSKGSQIGSSARPIPAASINGTGTVAKPHTALLSLPSDILRSGAVFKVKLTAALTSPGVTASAASAASPEFGLGKPLAPTITKVSGGENAVTVVLTMRQTVAVSGFATNAIKPTKFVLGLKPLLAKNSQRTAEFNVPAGAGPYTLTYQPATALPRDEWSVTVAARHSHGDSAVAAWPTRFVTGLPVAVTLGKVTVSSGGATIRFTHAPWYSQGLQARVRVWNPIGADGKLLAAGKEVEETLPAPTNANAGIIPAGAGALTRVAGVTNAYDVVVRIGSTAAQPIPRPGRWRLSVALRNAVGFGPASAKTAVLEVGLPHRVAAPTITGGRGQAAVRINQTRLEWRTITNPPSVQRYSVRLERLVNNKAQLAASTSVPAADAGKDVAFNGLAAGQYQALATPCGANGCAAQPSPASAVVTVTASTRTGRGRPMQ